MPQCAGIKRDGGRCEAVVTGEQSPFCYHHDPARQEERKRHAVKGGRSKASGEIGRVKARLQTLADAVEDGTLDKGVGAVVSQIWNVYLSAVRTELKVREVTELEERLEEVEEIIRERRSDRWGA